MIKVTLGALPSNGLVFETMPVTATVSIGLLDVANAYVTSDEFKD
jgi:hypothetical protein